MNVGAIIDACGANVFRTMRMPQGTFPAVTLARRWAAYMYVFVNVSNEILPFSWTLNAPPMFVYLQRLNLSVCMCVCMSLWTVMWIGHAEFCVNRNSFPDTCANMRLSNKIYALHMNTYVPFTYVHACEYMWNVPFTNANWVFFHATANIHSHTQTACYFLVMVCWFSCVYICGKCISLKFPIRFHIRTSELIKYSTHIWNIYIYLLYHYSYPAMHIQK